MSESQIAQKQAEDQLVAAVLALQKELKANRRLDVKKDFSLMVADVAVSKAIHAFHEAKSQGQEKSPCVVTLDLSGGAIHDVNATSPVRVIIIDRDTEGAESDDIHEIDGKPCFVRDQIVGMDLDSQGEALSLLQEVERAQLHAETVPS